MNNTIEISVDNDGIAKLVIDLPDKPMNVMSPELISDLSEIVDRVTKDDDIKGAILTSGKAGFIAGADIKDLVTAYDRGTTPEQGYEMSLELSRLYRRLETCGKPFAAAINGLALGGGLELCLACHYRVLSDHPKAVLGLPEVSIGLLPGAGGTQRLPRLIGISDALPVILQGKKIKPAKALELGIVQEVAPVSELVERAKAWILESGDPVAPWDKKGFRVPGGAGAMTPKNMQTFMMGTSLLAANTQHNYPAPIAALSAVYEGCITPIDAGLDIESQYFGQLVSGATARNMMRTLFVNKGAADKLAHRPEGIEKFKVRKIAILGAGMMGAGVAYVSARAGIQVVLLDVDMEAAQRGKAYSEGLLNKAIKRGYSTEEKAKAVLNLIKPTADYEDLVNCDLVVEAVFENRELKAEVTAKSEAIIPRDAIFATNTSTLPITGLAKASKRPESFIGLHFFSPVDKMPLVELIVGEKSSDGAIARGLDYIQQIRKTPIVVNDSPEFYTSRVFGTFTNEGMTMLAEGIKPALIENAAKMAGFPVGPLAVVDEVTLELLYQITMQNAKDRGDEYEYTSGFPVVRKFVEDLDRKGKRFGKGFYDYPKGGKKHLWQGLDEHYPQLDKQPPVEELINRLLYRQALEAAHCFEQDVLNHPADADIGSILGWGFPPWTGGALSFIDTMGLGQFVAECDRMADTYGSRFRVSDGLRQRASENMAFFQA